ncbi:MAG: hypothetical protein MMC33_006993 [Icmadophila ericetorum]|nr:hypothetical protein [Icmadophila ericetorum]
MAYVNHHQTLPPARRHVYISYLMQLGISVIGAVMLACLDIVCKMKEVPRWLRNLPGWEQMMKKNNHHSKKIRNWSEKNLKRIHEHHLPALVAGLVEFHKAQCLFTITIQIAAIIVWSKHSLTPTSLTQLYADQLLIQILAINGLVPVSCTILSLWVYGKRSWYLLLLSIVSFVISTTAYFVAAYHSFYAIETTYTPYSKCGNIDPTGLCGIAFVGVIADIGAGAYTFICVLGLMIVILTLHKLSSSYPSVSDPLKKRFKSQSKVYQNLIAVWNSMIGVYIIRYIIFFGAVMFSIQIYSFETLEALGLIDTTNWSFGQIVGIAVWAPPIFEYLKTWIQGIEKGSGYRLAHGYQVSKIPVAGQITRTPSQHGSELPTIVPTNPRDPSSSPSPLPSSHPQGEHEHGSVVQPKQSGAGSAVPLSTESTVLLHDQEIMQTAMPLQALTPSQSPSRQSSLDGRTQGFKPIPHSMTA